MPNSNPYAPPLAEVRDMQSPAITSGQRAMIVTLAGIQLGFMVLYAPLHFELVRVGASNVLSYLASNFGALCLYIAVARLWFKSKGKLSFWLASLSFVSTLPMWGFTRFISAPFYIGLVAALFGIGLTMRAKP